MTPTTPLDCLSTEQGEQRPCWSATGPNQGKPKVSQLSGRQWEKGAHTAPGPGSPSYIRSYMYILPCALSLSDALPLKAATPINIQRFQLVEGPASEEFTIHILYIHDTYKHVHIYTHILDAPHIFMHGFYA